MKHVAVLRAPPPGLATFSAGNPDVTDWSTFRNGDAEAYRELRYRLRRLQRGLCAFCEIRLLADDEQVEHWVPKSMSTPVSNWTFDVANMHASCENLSKRHWFPAGSARGADPRPGPNSSCGQAKGNASPSRAISGAVPYRPTEIPVDAAVFQVISDGSLSPVPQACHDAGLDDARVRASITFLNLDCTRLRHFRKAIVESLDRILNEAFEEYEDPVQALRETCRQVLFVDEEGMLPEFLSTIRSFFGPVAEERLRDMPDWAAEL